jgi:hypothetical protein
MTPSDARVVALAAAIVAVVDALSSASTHDTADELIPLTVAGLAARNMEHRPILRLAESGALRTVRIGRKRYTRPSWVAVAAETLAAPVVRKVKAETAREDLLEQLRGGRRRTQA